MFVKASPDGRIFVANDGNWRIAGPFESEDSARGWIAGAGGSLTDGPVQCWSAGRQKRTNRSVTTAEVVRNAPTLLSSQNLSERDREFVLRMQSRAERRQRSDLLLTDRQVKWWRMLTGKYGAAA